MEMRLTDSLDGNNFDMSRLAVLVVVALSMASTLGQKSPEYMMKMAEECIASEGLTPDDVSRVMAQGPPVSQAEKCFAGCMFEKMGLFENGVLNKEKSQQICRDMFEGDMLQKALTAHALCDKEMEGVKIEKCEGAAKMITCFHKTMTDLPMGPPKPM